MLELMVAHDTAAWGATRLYEQAGMRVLYEVEIYEKELRAGTV